MTTHSQTGNGPAPADAELRESLLDDGDGVEAALAEVEEIVRDVIRAHPVVCVLGAAAAGYLLARLVRDV